MSTYYRPMSPFKLDDVRNIEEIDVVEVGNDWGFKNKDSFLSVETNSEGYVIDVYRHGSNDVDDIFPHIEKELAVTFISEEDDYYSNFRHKETKVYKLRFDDGQTCYRTKSEDDSGVISLQYNLDGNGSNSYKPNGESSNVEIIKETPLTPIKPYKSLQELKDQLCNWFDHCVMSGDVKDVSSKVDDNGRLHFKFHSIVLTNPESKDEQDLIMTLQQVSEEDTKNV
jgi:hypothetical protein